MFLDESAFDLDDDPPSRSSRANHVPKSYGSKQQQNDLAIVLDEDMEDLSLGGGLGSAGGIGASSASRARFLAQQREITIKKQQQKISQSGMVRSSVESVSEQSSGQITPSIRQFSAPKAVREVESDFGRQSQSRSAPFSPQSEQVSSKSRRALEEEAYDAPKSRSDRRPPADRDERDSRRQSSRDTRGNDYDDYDRRKGPPSGSRRGETGKRHGEGWEEDDRDGYERRREKPRRKEDDYDDYARDTRSSRGARDRGESRRGEGDRRRKDDAGSSDEDRYRREKNRSRSPPPSRSTRRGRDDDDDDDRRRDRAARDDSRERRATKPPRRRDEYEEDDRVKDRDRDRDRRQRADGGGGAAEEERDPYDKKGKASGRAAGWNEREMASGDEDSEAPEKWASVGRAEGMVGPGSRSTGPPPSMPSVELDLSDMTRFLTRPLPRGAGIVQCHIVRNKSGTNKLYPIYSLYLKDNDRFLMCSKKRPNNKTSNYLISKKENDLSRDSPNYLGKLRSNFVGTEFQVFDNGSSPDEEDREAGDAGHDTRRELGAITYAPNVLGSRGPRKMQAVVPAVDESNAIVSWRQNKGSEGEMLQRIKDRNFKDLCYLINKPPRWNEQVGAYVLNFSGRVTMASVKNFQLVDPDEQNAIILQFGRVGKDQFTMDMQWPMSPFQAFAITLSSFDSKIACD